MKSFHNLLTATSLILLAAPLALAFDDPFADTKFHYLGGGRLTGANDYIKAGDFPDARFAADPSNPLHGANGQGYTATNDCIRLENVVCPFRGVTLTNVPCLYLAQRTEMTNGLGQVVETGGKPKRIWSTRVALPSLFPVKDQITAFVRFRSDGNPQMGTRPNYIMRLGYNWTDNTGFMFGVSGGDSSPVLCCFPGKNSSDSTMSRTSYRTMSTNKWVEAALTCSGTSLTFYMMCDGSTFVKQTKSISALDASGTSAKCTQFSIGGEDYVTWTGGTSWPGSSTKNAYWQVFRGSIHELAIWDRALSEDEIKKVFAGPRSENGLWRLGTRDGAANEFTGASDAVNVPEDGNWRGLKPTLTSNNPSVTVNYKLPHTTDETLPKRLVVSSTPDSAAATLGVSVNGTRVGEVSVMAGSETEFTVSTNNLSTVDNTLSLTLERGGPFTFDALRLENMGWQIGYDNNTWTGFSKETESFANTDYYTDCQDWYRCHRSVTFSDYTKTNRVHFALSPKDARSNAYRLTLSAYTEADTTPIGTMNIHCYVNGVKKATLPFEEYSAARHYPSKNISIDFEPGELLGGENVVAFEGEKISGAGWLGFNYFRLDVFPIVGLTIIIR